ncbi:hypothetical protein ACTGJ9_028855 [Bradyrhizobium sp. RDM12]
MDGDIAIRLGTIDNTFVFCSYVATEREAAMDNRINDIRRTIRALRVSMREAEAIMHEQINRDEDCSFVAQELIKMRLVMSLLAKERTALGDNEPILVNSFLIRGAGRRESRPRLLPRPSRRCSVHARWRGLDAGVAQSKERGAARSGLPAGLSAHFAISMVRASTPSHQKQLGFVRPFSDRIGTRLWP